MKATVAVEKTKHSAYVLRHHDGKIFVLYTTAPLSVPRLFVVTITPHVRC
jgi:hypothetical protein